MSIVPSRAVGRRAVAFVRGAGARRLASPGPVRVSATLRSFSSQPPSGDPPTGKGATNDLPSHATPSVEDFRNQEFKLTGLASRMRQEKQRLIQMKNEQGAAAEILKKREAAVLEKEAANKKVKVDLVFVVHGVKVHVGQVDVERADFDNLKQIQNDLNLKQPGGSTCIVENLCCLGLDRDILVQMLKDAFANKPGDSLGGPSGSTGSGGGPSGSTGSGGGGTSGSTGSGGGPSGSTGSSGGTSGSTGSGGSGYKWDWLWNLFGKQAGQSFLQWCLATVLRSVDWQNLLCYCFAVVETGVVINWDLIVNMYEVYKETKMKDTKAMFDEARARTKAAKAEAKALAKVKAAKAEAEAKAALLKFAAEALAEDVDPFFMAEAQAVLEAIKSFVEASPAEEAAAEAQIKEAVEAIKEKLAEAKAAEAQRKAAAGAGLKKVQVKGRSNSKA